MTDKISDEARELVRNVYSEISISARGDGNYPAAEGRAAMLIQSALTAARNQALDDAANAVISADVYDGRFIVAKAIRAMKVQ